MGRGDVRDQERYEMRLALVVVGLVERAVGFEIVVEAAQAARLVGGPVGELRLW